MSPKHTLNLRNQQPICSIISLGCPKNLIDSEIMVGKMLEAGFRFQEKTDNADVVILNTCGFLHDARSEAREILELLIKEKNAGRMRKIVVAGCAVQVEREKLQEMFPAVDFWFGIFDEFQPEKLKNQNAEHRTQNNTESDTLQLQSFLPSTSHQSPCAILPPLASAFPLRHQLTFPHVAYLKIAEGCSRHCAYCLIPKIRGKYISRSKIEILDEAKRLADNGVREMIVIAQETNFWGMDTVGKPELAWLLAELQEICGIEWLRLMYTYPAYFSEELIELFASGGKLLPYIDMPLQHSHDTILRNMNRKVTRAETEELLGKLRERIPHLVMRTSLITGFPGETDAMFEDLLAFTDKQQFERAGVFRYSREEGTAAAEMPDQIDAAVKEKRYARLYELTEQLTRNWAVRQIGKRLNVLIDQPECDKRGRPIRGVWVGRTYADAPTIDPVVIVTEQSAAPKHKTLKKKENASHSIQAGLVISCEIITTDGVNLIAVPD
ncbi:MAG: 30S ribosomal protein S12 methylthiotransferase RimO [Planctomycetaceae bacterium]|jgi:ribosomal protein S12 methylthiotransferase|nr:30S ribosomal protein S12 methylthiotransferase RimO [Planctomycetaceae bacterium]